MATRKEEPYGQGRKKMHQLMIETGVLSIDQASEWEDTYIQGVYFDFTLCDPYYCY